MQPRHIPPHLDALRKTYGGPMSEKEVEFLRDIQGFLDYAIRNGLSFGLALGTLSHDVNGITRYGSSLDEALTDFFRPNVTGYSECDEDSVGAPESSDD